MQSKNVFLVDWNEWTYFHPGNERHLITQFSFFFPAGPVYVNVQVTRASQNPPYFEQKIYPVSVNEGLMYNNTVTTIIATDPNPGMKRSY